jgi:hypothetical protein
MLAIALMEPDKEGARHLGLAEGSFNTVVIQI